MSETTKLTLRRRRFLKKYAQTGNATKAANFAYNCKNDESAASLGSWLLRKLKVPLRDILDAQGITDEYLADGLKEGIEAKETKFAIAEGKFTDEKEVVNLTERRKNRELAHKLRGDLSSDIMLDFGDPVIVNIGGDYVPNKPVDTKSAGTT